MYDNIETNSMLRGYLFNIETRTTGYFVLRLGRKYMDFLSYDSWLIII
jgi:hypothetical protein